MQVLVSSLATAGHIAAVRSLGRAAVEAGADVRVVVDAQGSGAFAGVATSIAPLPPMSAELAARSERAWGEAAALGARGDLDASNAVAVRDGFGAVNAARALPTLRQEIRSFRPDLVLADPFEPAALIASAEADVPLALASWSIGARLPSYVSLLLEGAAESTGTNPDVTLAHAVRADRYSPLPPSLDDPAPDPWSEPIRSHPCPHVPRAASTNEERPFVYATLGTIVGAIPPLANRFLACLAPAVQAAGADCLVTVGRSAVLDALDAPAGLRIEPFADHALVMPAADVVVSHGGINTVLDAAACGVPQVVLPMQASDQHDTARRLSLHGAGIGIEAGRQTADTTAAALQQVLDRSDHRRRAQELADDMAQLPSASAAWRRWIERDQQR